MATTMQHCNLVCLTLQQLHNSMKGEFSPLCENMQT